MRHLCFALLLFASGFIQAQLVADAGPDQHVCGAYLNPAGDSIQLGGQPAAAGGPPPYTYSWAILDSASKKYHLYASDFLTDTITANPKLDTNLSLGDEMSFLLKVTDNNNAHSYDTVKLSYSYFSGHLAQFPVYLNAGDTMKSPFGPGGGSDRGTLKCLWRPQHGMIDSTSIYPTIAPTETTAYYAIITDSAGCSHRFGSSFIAIVSKLDVDSIPEAPNDQIEVFPIPLKDHLRLSFPKRLFNMDLRLEITDLGGKVVKRWECKGGPEITQDISLDDGLYFLRVFKEEKVLGTYKLIVKR